MARMIPLHIPVATESAAERKLFDEFEHGCPSDWIVLHSLDLARRGSGPFGEADFVVIAPGYGILCVEAKTYLSRTPDGLWLTSPTGDPQERSPFQQASGAMYRIVEWIRAHNMPDVLSASIVVVPDAEVDNKDHIDWAPWQLIDRSRYLSKSVERIVCDSFDAQREMLTSPPTPLTAVQAERIVQILRSEVECYVSPRARIDAQLEEIRRFTPQQFRVLDQLSDNPRLVIDGLAGTGKTMLAIESARRAVESGRRVLFLCFNRLLADWLAEQTAPLGEACRTCTIHEFMQGIVGEKPTAGSGSEYWDKVLPERVFCQLADLAAEGKGEMFDELVIDEAQDILLNDAFLSVLDTVLAQGLEHGRWRFFGDFLQQDIFGRFGESPQVVLATTIGFEPPLVRLRQNCRNLPRVAHLASEVAGLSVEEAIESALRDDDGFDPRIIYYDGSKTQRKALVDALDMLHAEGFKPGEIVVLSRRKIDHCCAAGVDADPWRGRLRPFTEAGGTHTGYDSIFRFKGREAPAIVVTDIDELDPTSRVWDNEERVRSLLYVAATRSLSRLVLLVHESWRGRLELAPVDGTGLDAKEAVALTRHDPEPDPAWFVRPNGFDAAGTIHGLGHTRRVLAHARALAEALGFSAWEREALTLAALWHDIGRTDDGADYYHGAKSAGKAVTLGLHRGIEPRVYETALYAVTHHCGDEGHGERAAGRVRYQAAGDDRAERWDLVDPAAALRVFRALKDADGLDRVRLGDLDPARLRCDEARARVDRAWGLLREIP